MNAKIKWIDYWNAHNEKIMLAILLLVFMVFSMIVALRLEPGIIPDEPAHFSFSSHFASTPGIPADTFETYRWGWYIEGNPFVYHWLMGRFINLISLISPNISDFDLLRVLRLVNSLFGLATLVFCYMLSREVVQKKYWQLLPVFLLANTQMFLFLSGGLSYDNLANLLSIAGLVFLIRSLRGRAFVTNSLTWMIMIGLGTLVKYTILPLALIMVIVWAIYLAINHKRFFSHEIVQTKTVILGAIILLIFTGNFLIYGVNLIRYGSLMPPCREILLEAQCEISPFERRGREIALANKLTISEASEQGYPSPLGYALVDWVWHMALRLFGVTGHQSYFPFHLVAYYQYLLYGLFLLGVINLIHYRKIPITILSLAAIVIFYAITLIFTHYNAELVYGFQHISLQGRYILPVIGAIYSVGGWILKSFPVKILRWIVLVFILGLFIYGGFLTFLTGYGSVFSSWFI